MAKLKDTDISGNLEVTGTITVPLSSGSSNNLVTVNSSNVLTKSSRAANTIPYITYNSTTKTLTFTVG